MKKVVILSLLFATMSLISCDDDVVVTVESSMSQPGIYTANYSVKGKTLQMKVTKESSDPKMLLVVNVDEQSDTISLSYFSHDYPLSKGDHTLSVESGYVIEGGNYQASINTKTSTTIQIK